MSGLASNLVLLGMGYVIWVVIMAIKKVLIEWQREE